MSKKKRRQKAPASRRGQEQQKSGSLVIPVLVGLVLVAVVVAVIASFENRGTTPSIASIPTTTPLPTREIPYPDVPRISLEETQQRVAAGEAVIVDVRSAESYQQSHIAGAISLPETEVEARVDELPRDVELIFYCTWAQENQSARVAQTLMDLGFDNVSALLGGFAAWQEAGLPLEATTATP